MPTLIAFAGRFMLRYGFLLSFAVLFAETALAGPDPRDPLLIRTFSTSDLLSTVWSGKINPNGNGILISDGYYIWLYNGRTGNQIKSYKDLYVDVLDLAFTSDGSRFLVGGRSPFALLVDVATGAVIHKLEGPDITQTYFKVDISPDNRKLLTVGYLNYHPAAYVWDAASGKVLQSYTGEANQGCGQLFSPDGSKILLQHDFEVQIWDATTTNSLIRTLAHQGAVIDAFTFSPDGTKVVTSSMDGVISWDAQTGDRIKVLSTDSFVNALAYSKDGTKLVVGGSSYASVLDAETGNLLVTYHDEHRFIEQVDFSGDGRQVLTVDSGELMRQAHLWRAAPPAAVHDWVRFE